MPLARKEERVLNEVGSLEPQNPPCSHWSEARSQCHSFSLSFSLLYVSINLSTPCFSSSHGFSHLPQPNYKYPYSGNISPTDFFFFPHSLVTPISSSLHLSFMHNYFYNSLFLITPVIHSPPIQIYLFFSSPIFLPLNPNGPSIHRHFHVQTICAVVSFRLLCQSIQLSPVNPFLVPLTFLVPLYRNTSA